MPVLGCFWSAILVDSTAGLVDLKAASVTHNAARSHLLAPSLRALPPTLAQVFILDCLAGYDMSDPKDAEKVAERVLPRLQHANSAVVLSAVKVRTRRIER